MAPVISVKNLVKTYGTTAAVAGVSFDIGVGEVVAVLGPNGAGKTTTMEILEGYRERSSGTVSVFGHDPHRARPAARAAIGMVPQTTALDHELTVLETLRLYASFYPAPRPVGELLALLGLEEQTHTRVGRLSGGQQRRVDLAVGIVGSPRLLFLDEPTTGFDPAARRYAWGMIEHLAATGTTVLITTHYLEEARRLADRVIVLSRGRIVADDSPERVGRLLGEPTRISFRLTGHTAPDRLPAALAALAETDVDEVVILAEDVTGTLGELLDWARREAVDLPGLTVVPTDLEDAYLALVETRRDGGRADVQGPADVQGLADV